MKYYYLAYGSNLNLRQMAKRCHGASVIGKIDLEGYRLVYKGSMDRYAYLTIEKADDSKVPLGLFEVTKNDIRRLDAYEGYPTIYGKKYIPVKVNGEVQYALIYVMNENFDYHLPSINYVNTCKEGYAYFDFNQSVLDKAYIDTAENLPKKLIKRLDINVEKED